MRRTLAELFGLADEVDRVEDLIHLAVKTCAPALARWDISVSAGEPARPRATATSTVRAQVVDGAQLAAGEGPCEDAFTTGTTVTTPDVRNDPRWPRLGRAIHDTEIAAVVAVPLLSHDGVVGALNTYGGAGVAIDPQVVETSEMLAITLSSLINEIDLRQQIATLQHDLSKALSSRATIDQAKGIVMADQKCTADEAFAFLVELSNKRNVKVRDLAQMLVDQVSRGAR